MEIAIVFKVLVSDLLSFWAEPRVRIVYTENGFKTPIVIYTDERNATTKIKVVLFKQYFRVIMLKLIN